MKILRLSLYPKGKIIFFNIRIISIPCCDILSWMLSLKLVENPPGIWEPPS